MKEIIKAVKKEITEKLKEKGIKIKSARIKNYDTIFIVVDEKSYDDNKFFIIDLINKYTKGYFCPWENQYLYCDYYIIITK